MAKRKPRKPWLVEVRWLDSTTVGEGWMNIDHVLSRRHDAPKIRSVGFVLSDDDHGVVLAAGLHGREVYGSIVIPRGQITSVRRVK